MINDYNFDNMTKAELRTRRKLEDARQLRQTALQFACNVPWPAEGCGNDACAVIVSNALMIERYLSTGASGTIRKKAK